MAQSSIPPPKAITSSAGFFFSRRRFSLEDSENEEEEEEVRASVCVENRNNLLFLEQPYFPFAFLSYTCQK